jgi:iron complex outermembrane receptor protein
VNVSRSALLGSVAIAATALMSVEANAEVRHFDIPAQSARTGIPLFAHQAGIQILVPQAQTDGLMVARVAGDMEVEAALHQLLSQTDLQPVTFGKSILLRRPGTNGGTVHTAHVQSAPVGASDEAGQSAVGAGAGEPSSVPEDIIVSGFRSSLGKALNIKESAAGQVDAILAEDIAKFPDLNLAESIQRLPGVTIDRENGEGRTISVRGLGSQFTQTRINGMEAQAALAGNGNRGFDFSMFASELFNSIKVNKTQSAELEEGSLGATVDLQTGRPLGFGAGMHYALSGQGSYNDLAKNVQPRIAGLLSWSNADKTFGVLISAAFSKRNPISESFNTTRWQAGDPSKGYGAANSNNFAGCIPCTTDAQRTAVLGAFYPRIPRYTFGSVNLQRLGLTGSVQWAPSDRTEVAVDVLFGRYKSTAESPNIEAIGFSRSAGGVRDTVVDAYEIDPAKNTISYGVFDNVDVRVENGLEKTQSTFQQVSLNARHEFTDRFRGTIKLGESESRARTPLSVAYKFDALDKDGYTYDFRQNDRLPLISYGFDVTDGRNFTLTEWSKSRSGTNFRLRNASGALEYDLLDGLTLKSGGTYHTYGFDTFGYQAAVTVLSGADRATNVTNLGKLVSLDGALAIPNGSDLSYIAPDIGKISSFISLYDNPLVPAYNGTRRVEEKDAGGFLQADFNTDLFGIKTRGNVGVRYARTAVDSTGFLAIGAANSNVTVNNHYQDWLPSFNLAIEPLHKLTVRLGAAKVMSRPSLGDLTPGGSLSTTTQRVTYGNPLLKPFRATNYDASIEWYFAKESLLAVAGFIKDIKSFTSQSTETVPWRSLGLPDSLLTGTPSSPDMDFDVTRTINGQGGTLKGIEIQYQQPFTFLPGLLHNLGFIGNATFVKSRVNYGAAGFNRLTGQSNRAFNATLYYETKKISTRVSAAYRGKYLLSFPGGNGNTEEGVNATLNIDASFAYNLTKNITLQVQGVNLTDEYNDRYTDVTDRVSNYRHFGREILFGARATF